MSSSNDEAARLARAREEAARLAQQQKQNIIPNNAGYTERVQRTDAYNNAKKWG